MLQIKGVCYEDKDLANAFANEIGDSKPKYYFVDEIYGTVFVHDELMNKICEHQLALDLTGDGLSIDKLMVYGKTTNGSYVRMYLK